MNIPAYFITPVPCNDIRLRSRRVSEPLAIEDVPSSVIEERMNHQYPSNTKIPIIEDVEIPTETLPETREEIVIKTEPTQLVRELPYPK